MQQVLQPLALALRCLKLVACAAEKLTDVVVTDEKCQFHLVGGEITGRFELSCQNYLKLNKQLNFGENALK